MSRRPPTWVAHGNAKPVIEQMLAEGADDMTLADFRKQFVLISRPWAPAEAALEVFLRDDCLQCEHCGDISPDEDIANRADATLCDECHEKDQRASDAEYRHQMAGTWGKV